MASLGVRSRLGQRDGGDKGGRVQQAEGQQMEGRGQATADGSKGQRQRGGAGRAGGEQEGRGRAMQSR